MLQKKKLYGAAAVTFSLLLSGCSLLPEEEAYPAAPVIKSYETVSYEQTPVLRGDLILENTVQCRYMANNKVSMGFSHSGEKIDGIYVTEGQEVKAGDILAALEENGLSDQVVEQEYLIKELELKKSHLQENWALAAKQLDAWDTQGTEEYAEAKGAMDREYELEIQDVEDSLYIERMRLTQLQEELASRSIRAEMDGTVLYVKDIEPGDNSVIGETIVSLADMSSNAFKVQGDDASYFPVGTACVIEVDKKPYEAVSVDAAALGIADADSDSEDETAAYLQLVTPDPTLENGDKGNIVITLAESFDTLYVDKKAVQTAEGRQFVYMLNDEGLRIMQDVTVGIELKNTIEILSGLEEGDSVILD